MTREEEIRDEYVNVSTYTDEGRAYQQVLEEVLDENQRLQKAIELSTNLHEGRRQTTKHMEELYKKAVSENKRLQDANNTMAAYLQSLANPDAPSDIDYLLKENQRLRGALAVIPNMPWSMVNAHVRQALEGDTK